MMISITTQTYDLNGHLLLQLNMRETDMKDMERRVSRAATLDGGVDITDLGFSEGDRTVILAADVSPDELDHLEYLFKTYPSITVSLGDGIYKASFSRLKTSGATVTITLLFESVYALRNQYL